MREANGGGHTAILDRIGVMLRSDAPQFPPTVLYNENWLLRLVMDWIVEYGGLPEPFPVSEGAVWFSEALLPSAFLARHRGDPLAESHTHADGVIGHFSIGGSGKGDLVLAPGARQLSVLEGKVFSRLSPGGAHARYFDQAARNVACVAEVLQRAGRDPEQLDHLSFHVVAPARQIEAGIFGSLVTRESVRAKVERRVGAYDGVRDEWYQGCFLPTLDRITLDLVAWEEIVDRIANSDPTYGQNLMAFYQRCLDLN